MTDVQDTQPTQDAQAIPNAETSTSNAETSRPDAQAAQSTPATPSSPDLADKARPLDDLIASIRAAVVPGVSTEARAVGAAACRAILTALETQVGQPLAAATAAPTSPTSPTSPLAGMLSHLAAMPREQLIEFLLSRLRSALPPGAPTQLTAGPRFHIVTLPPPGRR